jgi:hypothetical protein
MAKPTRLLGIAAVALLAACTSDSGVEPATSATLHLGTAFNEMTVPGISAAMALGGISALPYINGVPLGCSYAVSSQNYVCPAVVSSGLTMMASYWLFDAAGQPMPLFDPGTIASLRVKNTMTGTMNSGIGVLTIDGQQDQTLSGLQSTAHTLNGTSTISRIIPGSAPGPAQYSMRSTTTITNLVLSAYGVANAYPTSGTVTIEGVTSSFGGPPITRTVTMTFNGTSKVNVSVSVQGLPPTACTIDLKSGTSSCG